MESKKRKHIQKDAICTYVKTVYGNLSQERGQQMLDNIRFFLRPVVVSQLERVTTYVELDSIVEYLSALLKVLATDERDEVSKGIYRLCYEALCSLS